ncbi:MAG: hypothetical protein JWO36_5692 [Myxococcales bacterium]|nr:hypothetical protein [Myxococcales bacterium]
MSDFQNEMNRVVQGFVAQITELAKRAAIDTLESALGRGARGVSASFSVAARNGRGRGRGAKRTSEDLDKLAENFHAFVTKHPGMRIEQINKQLGTTTKDLALPIRKLISDGELKTKGTKRSTTYFAGESKKKKN